MEKQSLLLDFLLHSYFGHTRDICSRPYEELILICANRAYRDFCRTISYRKDSGGKVNDVILIKIDFQQRIIELIKADTQNSFDASHDSLCGEISSYQLNDILENQEHLTYGQAQKWVNMTLKYMYMIMPDKFSISGAFLHVPVDSYIIKASSSNRDQSDYGLGVKPTTDEVWSKWGKCEYCKYQMALRTAIQLRYSDSNEIDCPIKWEMGAWMEQAKIESNK